MLDHRTTNWACIIHHIIASPLRHSAVFTIFSHPDGLPDVFFLAGCLDETGLGTVFPQSVGDVLAVVDVRVPVAHYGGLGGWGLLCWIREGVTRSRSRSRSRVGGVDDCRIV